MQESHRTVHIACRTHKAELRIAAILFHLWEATHTDRRCPDHCLAVSL
jgi:hypothetical protein